MEDKEIAELLFVSRFYTLPSPPVFSERSGGKWIFKVHHPVTGRPMQKIEVDSYGDICKLTYRTDNSVYEFELDKNNLKFYTLWYGNVRSAVVVEIKKADKLRKKFSGCSNYMECIRLLYEILEVALDAGMAEKVECFKRKDNWITSSNALIYIGDSNHICIYAKDFWVTITNKYFEEEVHGVVHSIPTDGWKSKSPVHRIIAIRKAICKPLKYNDLLLPRLFHAIMPCTHYIDTKEHKIVVNRTEDEVQIAWTCHRNLCKVSGEFRPRIGDMIVQINNERPVFIDLEKHQVSMVQHWVDCGNFSYVVKFMVVMTRIGQKRWG